MTQAIWDNLLTEAREVHARFPALQDFCPFPEPLTSQSVKAHHIPAAELMSGDTALASDVLPDFRDALIAAAPFAKWRETYKESGASHAFLDRFACYEVLGVDAAFGTSQMRSFVVYQPANFHYPWHHHPAEEMYLVIAGEAEFAIEGEPSKTLRPGDTIYHRSNVPHALTTHDCPIMAYVLWRGDLNTKPVFTYPEDVT